MACLRVVLQMQMDEFFWTVSINCCSHLHECHVFQFSSKSLSVLLISCLKENVQIKAAHNCKEKLFLIDKWIAFYQIPDFQQDEKFVCCEFVMITLMLKVISHSLVKSTICLKPTNVGIIIVRISNFEAEERSKIFLASIEKLWKMIQSRVDFW